MNIEEEKVFFHEQAKSLVGHVISRVRYSTIDYRDGKPYWDFKYFHNAEFGVELATSTGTTFQIGWDWKFHHYNLAILQFDAKDEKLWLDTTVMWEVTTEPYWASVVGEKIVRTTEYWCGTGDESYPSPDYPQDLEVKVESGRSVWFSAAGYDESTEKLFGMHDEIIIIFDEEVLRRHQFGEYTPKDWLYRTVTHTE